MRFGICAGDKVENISIVANAGFDYVESNFQFISNGEKERLDAYYNELKKYNIKCEAANCFLPGSLHATGPDVDKNALSEYVKRGMDNGARLGLKIAVFGSGGARRVPEGFSFKTAYLQLAEFLGEIVSPVAAQYGITVVTEPLSRNETNIINTVSEGVLLASFVDKENIKTLADLYHMKNVGENSDTVKMLFGEIKHAHISNPVSVGDKKRIYPKDVSEFDYKSFLDALSVAGCERCSIEANCDDFEAEAPIAIKTLRSV